MIWKGLTQSLSSPKDMFNDTRAGIVPSAFQGTKSLMTGKPLTAMKQFTRGPWKGLKSGWEFSFKGSLLFNAPMAALSMSMADRGHMFEAGVETMSTGVGALVGGALFGMPGAIVGGLVGDQQIAPSIGKGFQSIKDFDRNTRRLELGGGFEDTETAYTMRAAAAQEMASSLTNARQWLGREGAFLHS